MKTITKVDSVKLAQGIQQVLLTMLKDHGVAKYPIAEFERLLMEQKEVDREQAESVTEKIINTGIIRWSLSDNCFIL